MLRTHAIWGSVAALLALSLTDCKDKDRGPAPPPEVGGQTTSGDASESGTTSGASGGKGGGAGSGGGSADPYEHSFLYGGSEQDFVADLLVDEDGYVYVAGSTLSSTGDIVDSTHPGVREMDAWLLKLDSNGAIVWSVTYDFADSDSEEWFTDVAPLDDEYLVLGGTIIDDDDPGSEDDEDGFVMRIRRETGFAYYAARLSGDDEATETEHYDNDDEVTRVRGARSFVNSTLYVYEVLGQTKTRDSGPFPPASSSSFDGFIAHVYEPDPVNVGPTPANSAVLVGGSGGPDTLLFFYSENQVIGTTAGTNDYDFDAWKDEPEGFSDPFYYDSEADAVVNMVIANGTDVIRAMDSALFAGASNSSDGDVPCKAEGVPGFDFWFGMFDEDGPVLHCLGSDGDDEGIGAFHTDDGALFVVNTRLPGTGDFAALGPRDEVFALRVSESFTPTGMVAIPSPYGGSSRNKANVAARLPDGTLVVAGETQDDLGDTKPNRGYFDVWVTFTKPEF
jgi:hypothetical protein